MLAESYLLQGDLAQAGTVLGRSPDTLRDNVPPVVHSNLWRLHGRVAFARGEQSRAIALHNRALKQAEIAHDSRAIGLAHFYLGQCYRQVGDMAIVREHIAEAAAALHAAGDKRHLAMVHSLSAVMLAQTGRYDEANAALRQAERMASILQADDVLATVYGNQANVALIRHRYEQALALAERAVNLHEGLGQGPVSPLRSRRSDRSACASAISIAPIPVLHRALDVRSAMQFPRDHRRRLRHAGADVADARRLRERRRVLAPGGRGLRRLRTQHQPLV
jgi:tetratricopeptide (TPR) repeat protein